MKNALARLLMFLLDPSWAADMHHSLMPQLPILQVQDCCGMKLTGAARQREIICGAAPTSHQACHMKILSVDCSSLAITLAAEGGGTLGRSFPGGGSENTCNGAPRQMSSKTLLPRVWSGSCIHMASPRRLEMQNPRLQSPAQESASAVSAAPGDA